jgi:hypothetical protein
MDLLTSETLGLYGGLNKHGPRLNDVKGTGTTLNCNVPTRIRWTLFVCGLWSVVVWTLLLKCWICERFSHTTLQGKRASQKSAEQDTWIGPRD